MTRVQRSAAAAVLTFALSTGVAIAGQKQLGVEVYPGAKLLPAKSAYVKTAAEVGEAYCYRTADAPDAVVRFVLRQPGFQEREPRLLRRQTVDVVVHPPTLDRKTGITSPTVFCIMPAKD